MKIIKSLALVLFGTALLMPQTGHTAATKCVKLSPTTTCVHSGSASGSADWSSTCGGNVEVVGIAACSSVGGETGHQVNRLPAVESDIEGNIFCWCKMTNPALSKWVFLEIIPTAGQCMGACATECSQMIRESSAIGVSLRSGLFSDFGE